MLCRVNSQKRNITCSPILIQRFVCKHASAQFRNIGPPEAILLETRKHDNVSAKNHNWLLIFSIFICNVTAVSIVQYVLPAMIYEGHRANGRRHTKASLWLRREQSILMNIRKSYPRFLCSISVSEMLFNSTFFLALPSNHILLYSIVISPANQNRRYISLRHRLCA